MKVQKTSRAGHAFTTWLNQNVSSLAIAVECIRMTSNSPKSLPRHLCLTRQAFGPCLPPFASLILTAPESLPSRAPRHHLPQSIFPGRFCIKYPPHHTPDHVMTNLCSFITVLTMLMQPRDFSQPLCLPHLVVTPAPALSYFCFSLSCFALALAIASIII